MREKITDILRKVISSPLAVEVSIPERKEMGHYSTSIAFRLAKKMGQSPQKVAESIIEKIRNLNIPELEKIEEKNGYINFFIAPSFLQKTLREIKEEGVEYWKKNNEARENETIIVEYSQPNIAKKMHVGHLRTTLLGDALANIYEFLGYKVIRWNYLGDWGTQFGKLIAAYKLWGKKEEVERNPIESLLALYVRFHEELKRNPEFETEGQKEFKKLEGGDEENMKLWRWFKEESLKEFNKLYALLEVSFDTDIGESFYEKDLKPLVERLKLQGIAKEGDGGATIIPLGGDRLPALIWKGDGASLYLTRDIANIEYRISTFHPSRVLYVVGNEQSLHFEQLFAIARVMGITGLELVHVKYGLVLGESGKKFATREGNAVFADEVIGKAIALAEKIVEEKNGNLEPVEKSEIARTVAIGALKYGILKEHRNTDIVFNWDTMLDFSGMSGPYLQYTYARFMSILEKARPGRESQEEFLKEEQELFLIKHLLDFRDAVRDCLPHHTTNGFALYLYNLAVHANRFYETTPILKDENAARRNARLELITVITMALKEGLKILGVRVLSKI